MSDTSVPLNLFGGLTIITTPGLELLAETVKPLIEAFGDRPNNNVTPVSVVSFDMGRRRVNGEPIAASVGRGVCQHDCVVLASGPGTPDMIMDLLLTLYHLRCQGAKRITVIFGYFPLSRTDKPEERKDGKKEFALPPFIVSQMRAAAGPALFRILAFDLHALVSTEGEIVSEISFVSPLLQRVITDVASAETRFHVLHFTDAGAAKRAKEARDKAVRLLREAGVPVRPMLTYGSKERESDRKQKMEGRPQGSVRSIRESIVIAVDDEAATLGTLDENSRFLMRHYGAKKIWAVVTHPILCGKAVNILSSPDCPIDRLYVSDTIPLHNRRELQPLIESGRIVVVSMADELAKIIYYTHWGRTINRLR